jgi:hypothetical protein
VHIIESFRLGFIQLRKFHGCDKQSFSFDSADYLTHQSTHNTVGFYKEKRALALCAQALPFSSLPKYFVHLSLRGSLLSFKELFLHLLEQNHRIDPSFLTYIMPVPSGKSSPQNEHFLGLGKDDPPPNSRFTVIYVC